MSYGIGFRGDLTQNDLIKNIYTYDRKITVPSTGWTHYTQQGFYRRKLFIGVGFICANYSPATYTSIQGPHKDGYIDLLTRDSSKTIELYVFREEHNPLNDYGIALYNGDGDLLFGTDDTPCQIIDIGTIKSDNEVPGDTRSSTPHIYNLGNYGVKVGVLQEWFYSDRINFSITGGPIYLTAMFKAGTRVDVMQYRHNAGLNNVSWAPHVKIVDLTAF